MYALQIGANENRRRLLEDGSLQIINLYPYDKGIYVCTADNGIASPVRIEYQLDVTGEYAHISSCTNFLNWMIITYLFPS